MDLLLDTVTILWAMEFPKRLSPVAARVLTDPSNQSFASVVSVWEISVKMTRRRLKLAYALEELLTRLQEELAVELIDLSVAESLLERSLPPIHHDPFDRMLVCQALSRQLVIVTPDDAIREYSAASIW